MQLNIATGAALGAAAAALAARGAGLDAVGSAALAALTSGGITPAGQAAWRSFGEARAAYGDVSASAPVTPEALGGWLCALVLGGDSSARLGPRLSALLGYIHAAGVPQHGLDAAGAARVRALIPGLARSFPATILQMGALSDGDLLAALGYLEPHLQRGSLFALEWRAILLTARAGMWRSVDYLAPVMAAGHVTLVTALGADGPALPTVTVVLPFTKSEQAAFNPLQHRVTLPRDGRYGGRLDFYPALLAYASAAGITLGPGRDASRPLFPRYKRTSNSPRGTPGTYPYDAALADLRFVLRGAGLDAAGYGMHSLRSSGATHYLALGLPRPSVQKLGLWRDERSIVPYDRRGEALAREATALTRPR